ncbi:MAG: transcription antitermination factor NusB [Deltaproteobacteria bacterium]|nr:transcription antitermination factor NusB [Deltaproteobacteria bacterium]
MKKDRRKAREAALQTLYRVELSSEECASDIPKLPTDEESFSLSKGAKEYAGELVAGVATSLAKIDKTIEEFSVNWTMKRMSVIDKSVLRIAVFELLFHREVPFKVVIDEAVELAKTFGTDESGGFINGILGKIAEEKGLKKEPLKK